MTTKNCIYCGDNLQIMQGMESDSVDLIYLDPPFFSNRHYEVIWGDDQETQSFGDRWEGGIEHYIGWMSERLKEMHRILKPTGTIYLHADFHAIHYLKIEMDKIFGVKKFQNEIIWSYGARATVRNSGFPQKHDSILVYNKTKNYTYNTIYKPYKDQDFKRYNKEDENGRYALIKRKRSNGEVYYGKSYVKDGVPETDVWDIPTMASTSKERLGYPTQKPLSLLERIIKASSNPGDIVLDPFCGCGSALEAADKLNRQYMGIDVSPTACPVVAKRLGISHSRIIGMPVTTEDIKDMNPNHFQQWVCTRMNARNTSPNPDKNSGGDGGIDGIVKPGLSATGYVGAPIQIKHSSKVGVNPVKNFFATMHDMKRNIGFIVALSFGKGAVEQVAKYKNEGSVEIVLVRAEEIAEKGYFEK